MDADFTMAIDVINSAFDAIEAETEDVAALADVSLMDKYAGNDIITLEKMITLKELVLERFSRLVERSLLLERDE